MRRFWWIPVIVGLAVVVTLGVVAARAQVLAPVQMMFHYPLNLLTEEVQTMNDCVECHEPAEFHTCTTCHDDHGSVEMAAVPFDDLLRLEGDVPQPGYIPINDILPYREYTSTHISLLDFLVQQKVTDFESVTLASRDEGFVTIEQPNLTPSGLLVPHIDGMRFVDENLHVSSWLKGIWRIIVVRKETPIQIDGQPTSMGRLLLGPTRSITIEQTDTMFKSPTDGQVRKAKTASRIEGAPIEILVAHPDFRTLIVRDENGKETTLSAEEAQGALVAQVREHATLVLPGRNRSRWIEDIAEIVSEP
jgi:hypothetical protein